MQCRDDFDRFLRAASTTIADLQGRIEVARERLADVEARAEHVGSLAALLGKRVLEAQRQIDADRLEANRVATAIFSVADLTARSIVDAAIAKAAALGGSPDVANTTGQVLDFTLPRAGVVESAAS